MQLQDVRFSNGNTLSVDNIQINTAKNTLAVFPNPMIDSANIHFTLKQSETIQLEIYNQLGAIVYQTTIKAQLGKNQITISKQHLSSGLYICKLSSTQTHYNPLKLLVK
jgi:hypothetical protein